MSGHTVTTAPSTRRVRVELDGELIADSSRVLALEETGHPTRFYLPLEDVRDGVLQPSERTSHCPFKGDASYYSARVNGEIHADVAWYYPEPIPAVAGIAGLVCFYPERVALTVD
jgi:uncharacterized protein (DUF427 family)